jgi:hypothetical protein
MKKRLFAVVLALVPLLALSGLGLANSGENRLNRQVREATEQFRSVPTAEAAGYGLFKDAEGIACIELAGVGGMGVHYVNGTLLSDEEAAVVDPLRPEAVVYAQGGGGRLKLAALEYIVFLSAWEEKHGVGADAPSLFGVEFDLTPAGNRYGIPAFYALHAWLFRGNPAGQFTPWNPKVTCPDA